MGDPFLFGVPLPGISSFTLPPSINLFTNYLNVSGLYWVDGLKNLSLTSQPNVLLSPISAACIEEPPSVTVLELFLPKLSPLCSPPESSDLVYFLHSCSKRTIGGLGKATAGTPRGERPHIIFFQSSVPSKKGFIRWKTNFD